VAVNFSTYGPYPLKEWKVEAISDLLASADKDHPGLQNAIGIYAFAIRDSKGTLIPQYVGKTINGFRIRFYQHFKANRFAKLFTSKSKQVEVFLIPRN
jgi:hypothetical protein